MSKPGKKHRLYPVQKKRVPDRPHRGAKGEWVLRYSAGLASGLRLMTSATELGATTEVSFGLGAACTGLVSSQTLFRMSRARPRNTMHRVPFAFESRNGFSAPELFEDFPNPHIKGQRKHPQPPQDLRH